MNDIYSGTYKKYYWLYLTIISLMLGHNILIKALF